MGIFLFEKRYFMSQDFFFFVLSVFFIFGNNRVSHNSAEHNTMDIYLYSHNFRNEKNQDIHDLRDTFPGGGK